MARKPRPKRWVFWGFTAGFTLFGALPLLAVLWAWVLPVPGTPLMVLRLLEGEGWSQHWVSLDEVAPSLVPAIIAAEDNTFCQHQGIDWPGLARAAREVERGQRDQARGASTLSMQVTKNLLLWPGRDELRKGLELTYLPWIEGLWSKRRILEVYINIVELGPGIYGVEAAARHHFGVPASALTPRQSALLAAVLPNPREWNAGQPGNYISQRAETLQRRAKDIAPLLTCF